MKFLWLRAVGEQGLGKNRWLLSYISFQWQSLCIYVPSVKLQFLGDRDVALFLPVIQSTVPTTGLALTEFEQEPGKGSMSEAAET